MNQPSFSSMALALEVAQPAQPLIQADAVRRRVRVRMISAGRARISMEITPTCAMDSASVTSLSLYRSNHFTRSAPRPALSAPAPAACANRHATGVFDAVALFA
jgi:hypothetical protein